MSLAIQQRNGVPDVAPARPLVNGYTVDQIWDMATWATESGMFPGVKDPRAAVTLMLLCRADGLDPIDAVRRFHIISGKPSMRADAVQASFQECGGTIEITERSNTAARAMFAHPRYHPKPVEFCFTIEDARRAGVYEVNPNYKKYPAQMLWARCVTLAVNTIAPGIKLGYSTKEELEDILSLESPAGQVQSLDRQAQEALAQSQTPVYGGPEGFDDRPYSRVATEALQALNAELAGIDAAAPTVPIGKLHGFVRNAAYQANYAAGVPPTKSGEIVRMLDSVYKAHPDWLRRQVNLFAREAVEAAHGAAKPAAEPETGTSREAINAAFAPAREPGEDDADPDVDYPEGT